MKNVECARCGYLAIRDKFTDAVLEATHDARKTGICKSPTGKTPPAKFFCYASSPAFGAFDTEPDRAFERLSRKVDCDSFTIYRPGKNPKEHEEMGIVEKVQLAAAESQAKHDAFYRKYLRVMWVTVIAAIVSGILSGLLSGWLAAGR